jgi:hypothetical protein
MKPTVPSARTWTFFAAAVGITLVSAALILARVGGDSGVTAVSDVGEAAVIWLAAIMTLWAATKLGLRTSVGRPWLLIGLGVALFAVGDTVWTIIEVGLRQEAPYPGLPDLFYLLEYPLVGVGIVLAGRAYRGLIDLRRPAVLAGVLGTLLTAAMFALLIWPTVLKPEGIPVAEKVVSALYPMGDVLGMFVPAIFVLLVVRQLGNGRLAWPWVAVAAGLAVISFADSGYSYLTAYDLYKSGSIVDYGWSIGHALVMLGALIARDLARPVA